MTRVEVADMKEELSQLYSAVAFVEALATKLEHVGRMHRRLLNQI